MQCEEQVTDSETQKVIRELRKCLVSSLAVCLFVADYFFARLKANYRIQNQAIKCRDEFYRYSCDDSNTEFCIERRHCMNSKQIDLFSMISGYLGGQIEETYFLRIIASGVLLFLIQALKSGFARRSPF